MVSPQVLTHLQVTKREISPIKTLIEYFYEQESQEIHE